MFVLKANLDYEFSEILGLFETLDAAIEARKTYRTNVFKDKENRRHGDMWDEYEIIEMPVGTIVPNGGDVVDHYRATKPR